MGISTTTKGIFLNQGALGFLGTPQIITFCPWSNSWLGTGPNADQPTPSTSSRPCTALDSRRLAVAFSSLRIALRLQVYLDLPMTFPFWACHDLFDSKIYTTGPKSQLHWKVQLDTTYTLETYFGMFWSPRVSGASDALTFNLPTTQASALLAVQGIAYG